MVHHILLGLLLCLSIVQLIRCQPVGSRSIDPTEGFISLPLDRSNFIIQRPYNVLENERCSFEDDIHKLWVYSADKPFSPKSTTKPRTEIRIIGYDYSSGVWQFEAQGYVPYDTSGVSIMQIYGGSGHNTTLMLRVYNGNLAYYKAPVIVPNVYDRWFRLNVIHNVEASRVTVYVDGILLYTVTGGVLLYTVASRATSHFFKCGVYAQNDESQYMESRWKGIEVLKKM